MFSGRKQKKSSIKEQIRERFNYLEVDITIGKYA
tara:strand:+ start:392 stop:493 length:102 start_codon:yes stop_codon:yes gene_type:complete